jgi:hypothetical protein
MGLGTSSHIRIQTMHWYKWSIIFLLLFTSSCGEKLSGIDLGSLLIQSSDLPNSLTEGPVEVIEPRPEVLCYDQAMEQEIRTRSGELAATVRVYLFRSKADRDKAYNLFSLAESQEGVVPYSVSSIGDRISARYIDEGGFEVVFIRCQAVVLITVKDLAFEDEIVYYAQRLDYRLASAVCP